MQALGWTEADFAWVTDLPMPDVPRALCNGEIDAAVFVVAHPNLAVEDVISTCNAVLVPVDGPAIEKLMGETTTTRRRRSRRAPTPGRRSACRPSR